MIVKAEKKPKGGVRTGAGAPKKLESAKSRTIRLLDDDWLKLKSLGGANWLKLMLSKH